MLDSPYWNAEGGAFLWKIWWEGHPHPTPNVCPPPPEIRTCVRVHAGRVRRSQRPPEDAETSAGGARLNPRLNRYRRPQMLTGYILPLQDIPSGCRDRRDLPNVSECLHQVRFWYFSSCQIIPGIVCSCRYNSRNRRTFKKTL